MNRKILFIDDDVELCQLFKLSFRQDKFEIEIAYDGYAGLQKVYKFNPDIVILDVMMPYLDGWETCSRIREMTDVPIIMLTSLDRQDNIIKGLDLGADDYVSKPVSPETLKARIYALLRRVSRPKHQTSGKGSTPHPAVRLDNIIVDFQNHEVTIDGQRVDLTPTEYRLLETLAKHKGRVLPHQYLLTEVWGRDCIGEMDYLRMYISYLRRKLEKDPSQPQFIQTEWSVGYRFG